jgi:hypothetical protein
MGSVGSCSSASPSSETPTDTGANKKTERIKLALCNRKYPTTNKPKPKIMGVYINTKLLVATANMESAQSTKQHSAIQVS